MLVAAQAGRRVKKRRMKIVRKIVAVAMMMMKRIFINLQLQTTIKRVKVGQLKFELKNKNSEICKSHVTQGFWFYLFYLS